MLKVTSHVQTANTVGESEMSLRSALVRDAARFEVEERIVIYWFTTLTTVAALIHGGVLLLRGDEGVVVPLLHLGYPAYVAGILACWKFLAAITLLAPGLTRLKEWAYAGIFFEFTGRVLSHLLVRDPFLAWSGELLAVVFTLLSWGLRPAGRRLGSFMWDTHCPGLPR